MDCLAYAPKSCRDRRTIDCHDVRIVPAAVLSDHDSILPCLTLTVARMSLGAFCAEAMKPPRSCARAAPIIVLSRTSIAGITFVDDQKICKGFMPSSAPVRLLTMLGLLDSETTLAPRFVQMSDFSRRCCDGVMLEATASYLADLPIIELPPRIRMVVPSFSVLMLGYHRAKNPL